MPQPILMSGRPKSCGLVTVLSPTDAGLNELSCGLKFSAKRFQPPRISTSHRGLITWVWERETICTRVGVTVL